MNGSEVIVTKCGAKVSLDYEDYRILKWFKWRLFGGYAVSGGQYMHRVIMDAPDHLCVDHANRNRLDNRKSNLRLATVAQNNRNMPLVPAIAKKVPYRGVSHCCRKTKWKATKKPWRAVIRTDLGKIHLGYFETQVEAAMAYDKAALTYHGEFATLNFQMTQLD